MSQKVSPATFRPVAGRPPSPVLGEVVGIDLSRPLDRATVDGLKAAWDQYALLLTAQGLGRGPR